jgi:hypothetical protein
VVFFVDGIICGCGGCVVVDDDEFKLLFLLILLVTE